MSERTVTVIGPAASGKTTYFAALWSLLTSPQIPYSLAIDNSKIVPNKEYLIHISDLWMRPEKIPHTPSGDWHPMELPLRHEETGNTLTLHIPDLGGESFHVTLENREWTPEFSAALEATNALLLFINPKKHKPVEMIDHTIVERLAEADAPPVREWAQDMSNIPSDVFYTDLLQQVAYHDENKHYAITIIVSAWDEITKLCPAEITEVFFKPAEWLSLKFPLLTQFIKSHPNRFDVKIFGVSAYGRDQAALETKEQLLKLEPEKRVVVVCDGQESNDITLPLARFFIS